jgi:hypothetical protein
MEFIYFAQFVVSTAIQAAFTVLVGGVVLKGAQIGLEKAVAFIKR